MHNPVAVLTDKVAHTIKNMICMAMRVSYRRGATVEDLSGFLGEWIPSEHASHRAIVERALQDLQSEGQVAYTGARWYPTGLAR